MATQAGATGSPFTQAETITCSSSVFSQTVQNISGSTTPTIAGTTMVATQFGTYYPPTVVPTGHIVVASVGGTPLANAQIDSQQCSFWPDGSLRLCPFSGFVPQMASDASQQVTFAVQSGSFPTSSSVTPATISAASDFKVVLSNVNGSYTRQGPGAPSVWWGVSPGFYVSGGAVTGGYIRNQPTAAASPQGLLGNNCTTSASNCITPSNYQASVSTTTASGSPTLTFGSAVVPSEYIFNNPGQITIIDTTNPSSIPDNTYVLSGGSTVTMSANAAANITSSDVLEFGYTIRGGTSNAAFTLNLNGSSIPTSVNIIKGGAGFSAVASGAMTADIDTILNAYGATQPPSCASMPGAATFTGTGGSGTLTITSGLAGVVSIGQMVDDGTNLAVITGGSGSSWTTNGTLAAGPIAMSATPAACVYVSGPTKYGIRGIGAYRDNVSGAKDAWERFRFTIEAWTGPTGLYAIKPTITTDNSIYKNHNGWPNYVYDADFKNGPTEIIGCAQGGSNNKWCAIQQQVNGSWTALDPCEACATGATGRPVWLPPTTGTYSQANSQGLAQVVISPAAADLTFLHASHVALPLNASIGVSPMVLSTTTGTFGSPDYANLYAPYEHGGTDFTTGFGSGGANHAGLGPMGTFWGSWYQAAANTASDNGASWLANMRVVGDIIPGVTDGPRYDDTGLPLNYFNSGSGYTPPAAFTDAAVWDFVADQYYKGTSYPNDFMWQGDVPSPVTAQPALANTQVQNEVYADTSHYPGFERGIYTLEAERYMLENWIDDSAGLLLSPANTDGNTRSLSFGGTRYDAQYMSSSISRQNSWWMNEVGPLTRLGPPNEPAIQYLSHVVANDYAMNYAFYSYIGSGNFWSVANGASQWGFNKYYDNTSNGDQATPEDYAVIGVPNNDSIIDTQFMQNYWALDTDDMVMLDNGNDANLTGWARNFLDNYVIKNVGSANTCTYNTAQYVLNWADTTVNEPSPYMNPQPGWNATTATGTPQKGNGPVNGDNTIHTEAGSSEVSASIEATTSNTGAWSFNPTATSAVSVGGTSIPVSSINPPQAIQGTIQAGWVIKDLTNPTALTWPTYVTGAPSGLNVPISSPVTGPGISANDVLTVSANWAWIYPVFNPSSPTRITSGTRMKIADVNWHDQTSPNDSSMQFAPLEAHTVPSTGPFTVTSTNVPLVSFSVNYAGSGTPLTKVTTPTVAGQYSVSGHTYTFSSGDAGANITINYVYFLGASLWPPSSSPQVSDGQWLWLCMDASGAAFGQLSTTQPTISGDVCTGGTTYVTWNVTADFSTATVVANASCPSASSGDWRNVSTQGAEVTEAYAAANWRQAIDGVLGTSTDAPLAVTNLLPYVTPLSTTYSAGQVQWGAEDHF